MTIRLQYDELIFSWYPRDNKYLSNAWNWLCNGVQGAYKPGQIYDVTVSKIDIKVFILIIFIIVKPPPHYDGPQYTNAKKLTEIKYSLDVIHKVHEGCFTSMPHIMNDCKCVYLTLFNYYGFGWYIHQKEHSHTKMMSSLIILALIFQQSPNFKSGND